MSGDTDEPDTGTANTAVHHNTFDGPAPIDTGPGDQVNNLTVAPPERRRAVLSGFPAGLRGSSAAARRPANCWGAAFGKRRRLSARMRGRWPAGVGKSALAIHTARHAVAQGWFQGGVWLNLRGVDQLNRPEDREQTITRTNPSLPPPQRAPPPRGSTPSPGY